MKFVIFSLLYISLFSINSYSQEKNIEALILSIEKSYNKVNDYSCKVYKKELINGIYYEKKNIIYKFKKPYYYYMKWTEGDDAGMEAIYAGKKYNNKMRVHLGGMMSFIDVEIDPFGKDVFNENRHSIFDSDLGYIIKIFKKNFNLAKKNKIDACRLVGKKLIDNKTTYLYEAVFPKKTEFYGYIIQIYICPDLNLPIKLIVYDWDKKIIESYHFTELIINNGFDDSDFDVNNPEYDY
jgi:outer membrane lipoprotein-sorting protein